MDDTTDIVLNAKKFAQEKHKNQKRKDGVTPYFEHIEGVVNRLKNLGIVDKDILCAAWLHDTIGDTDVTFDQINDRYGREVAVIVLSLTKDQNMTKKDKEIQYIIQLKEGSFQTRIINLCDISSNLKDVVNSPISKTQKNKQIKKYVHYLRVIKNDIMKNKSIYPKIQEIVDGINIICIKFNQKPI